MTSGSRPRDRDRSSAGPAGAPRGGGAGPPREPRPIRPRTPAESAALVISRALGADGRGEPPVPRRAAPAAALAALFLAAGAGGYIAGDSGSSPAKPRQVQAGAVGLDLPRGWQRRQRGGGIEAVATGLVAGPPGDEPRRIVAAELPREGLGLLPEAALARLDGVSAGEPVSLGGVRAVRYRAVESAVPRRRVSLYATPTTRGLALVVCAGPRIRGESFVRRCGDVAATLSLARGRRVSEPASDDVAAVDRTIALLDARRAAARRRLRNARSRASRVRLVHRLAEAHGAAARSLERLQDGSAARRASAVTIRLLRRVERAYRRLARAARRAGRRRAQAARRGVRRSDRELRRAVERL